MYGPNLVIECADIKLSFKRILWLRRQPEIVLDCSKEGANQLAWRIQNFSSVELFQWNAGEVTRQSALGKSTAVKWEDTPDVSHLVKIEDEAARQLPIFTLPILTTALVR